MKLTHDLFYVFSTLTVGTYAPIVGHMWLPVGQHAGCGVPHLGGRAQKDVVGVEKADGQQVSGVVHQDLLPGCHGTPHVTAIMIIGFVIVMTQLYKTSNDLRAFLGSYIIRHKMYHQHYMKHKRSVFHKLIIL